MPDQPAPFPKAIPIFRVANDQGHADAAWRALRDKGARVRIPPANYPRAREVHVEDSDGNVLRLGSGPIAGEPCGGWTQVE